VKRPTQIRQQIRECIASGISKPQEISAVIGYKASYVRQMIGRMINDKELERATVNGKSMIGFGLGQRLHDPFNLCKVAAEPTKEGRKVRKTPSVMPYKEFQYRGSIEKRAES